MTSDLEHGSAVSNFQSVLPTSTRTPSGRAQSRRESLPSCRCPQIRSCCSGCASPRTSTGRTASECGNWSKCEKVHCYSPPICLLVFKLVPRICDFRCVGWRLIGVDRHFADACHVPRWRWRVRQRVRVRRPSLVIGFGQLAWLVFLSVVLFNMQICLPIQRQHAPFRQAMAVVGSGSPASSAFSLSSACSTLLSQRCLFRRHIIRVPALPSRPITRLGAEQWRFSTAR